jgi:uncharacterized protein (TIGR03437 family)
MAFVGNACAFTGAISGSITYSAASVRLDLNVNMNGLVASFDEIAQSGNLLTGGYSASGPAACLGNGPHNWTATRVITIWGVTNAASFGTGPISPGEVISIFASARPFGSTPVVVPLQLDQSGKVATALGGVQVLFLGINVYAPLIFVSDEQVNAVVPYEVAGLTNVSVQVVYLGVASDPFNLPVASTAPGIFTASGPGIGQAAALNHDGTVNGPNHPEPRGGVVSLYLTGEGQIAPAGIDGKVTTVS